MNDERFDYELRSVLREIAGREAPMSLRNRVADVIDRAPLGRRLWFAPPMKLSLAAVGAAAVLTLAVLFVGSQMVGPTPSQTPEPSASASVSSIEPTPSASSEPTAVPTPFPTPGVVAWTGLDWAVGTTAQGSWWNINDVLPWGNGYVGVGSSSTWDPTSPPSLGPTSPAFFTSADGLHWTIAQEDDPIDQSYQGYQAQLPARLVPAGDAVLAIGFKPDPAGAPRLWRSENGSTWSPLDSATWRNVWTPDTFISATGGPSGLVAIGTVGPWCCANPQGPPVIIHSSDGVTWDRLDLSSAFDNAYFRDVAAYAGGFVIVGRVGEKQVMDPIPAVGRPAAWTSADGVTWLAAEVEGAEALGGALSTVIAGADGIFATGRQTYTEGGLNPVSGWASTDGRSWQLVGEIGTDLPLAVGNPAMVDGDGAHMVMFGRESCKTTELSAWTSLDGVTWTELTFSGETSYLPTISGPICNDDGTDGSIVGNVGLSYAAVLPDGVFVVTSSSAPTPPLPWFLTAVMQ